MAATAVNMLSAPLLEVKEVETELYDEYRIVTGPDDICEDAQQVAVDRRGVRMTVYTFHRIKMCAH